MAANTDQYESVIRLNTKQATQEIDKLQKKVENLRREQSSLAPDSKKFASLQKEIDKNISKIEMMQNRIKSVNDTIRNMSDATPKQLKNTIKEINRLLNSGDVRRGSEGWNVLTAALKKANTELGKIKQETKASQPVFGRFFKFLNDSWGGVVILFESFTRLSMSVRSSVEDFAKMEEAMANTRKYTGMTDEAVRDLNEDLKKMDTRTSREDLNELAGAAGRLGKTSKKDILDFVEAADMIKVALGDDLGEGAIDNVGKLAMAFGEDEKMGLRKAMLATGSAVNELAQNSSAQAGYLVDFTARVAGFGKQLGLTQAQIMGFGAVMDENLLRDEMAATAFGNMLTKMQTDTAKFARIAGMDVKKFSELLETDANAAILALADSLKKADPQTMMKMLDDMGLDGSRAVGVLSTLADKIDDVRVRQELATKAYREGTSVQNEFNTMNNTAQAELDKARNKFHELSVELGERLKPVVTYTISAGGILVRVLNALTGFLSENGKTVLRLAAEVAILTATYNIHSVAIKVTTALTVAKTAATKAAAVVEKGFAAALRVTRNAILATQLTWTLATKGVEAYRIQLRAARIESLKNPWTALATVVLAACVAVYELTERIKGNAEAAEDAKKATSDFVHQQELMRSVNEEANSSVAEEITRFKNLRQTLEDNNAKLEDRKKALAEIKKTVPEYHGQLTSENRLINSNTSALDGYITNLIRAARARAAFNKMVAIEENSLNHQQLLDDRKGNQRWAKGKLTEAGVPDGGRVVHMAGTGGLLGTKAYYAIVDKEGKIIEKIDKTTAQQLIRYQNLVEYNDRRIQQENTILESNRKQSEYLQKIAGENGSETDFAKDGSTTSPAGGAQSTYVSDSDKKKQAAAQRKAEREQRQREAKEKKEEAERKKKLKERADAAKAEYQAEIAEEMLAYRQGVTTYTDYMEERHQIAQNYYNEMKALYGEDSTEYKKLLDDREKDEEEYYQWKMKRDEKDIEKDKALRDYEIKKRYVHQQVIDEEAMNEELFRSEMDYLRAKQNLYANGSKDWEEMEEQIQAKEMEHRFTLEQSWMERLSQYRAEMAQADYDKLQEIELKGIDQFYGALVSSGEMTQEELDAIIEHVKRKYAELKGEQIANNDLQGKAAKGLETAKKNAGAKDIDAGGDAANGIYGIGQAIKQQKIINEQLKALYGEDYENNREYQEAKRQLDQETMQTIVAGAEAAYSTISSLMSAASNYAQACSDVETAKITADYDRQIEAAGNNSRKREQLEKERDKAIAKAKSKANKKAMAIEYAQAVASTALAAINAYASAAKLPPPAGQTLPPVMAGLAIAAGAIQLATIKKQHEAQSSGYYEGGFTGGRQYRKEAGVVHEGEFVANHLAVGNPAIRPFLNFLDQAQRNNRVASLRAEDVNRVMGRPVSQVVAPIVNVQNDNEELRSAIEESHRTLDRLNAILEKGIIAHSDTEETYKSLKKYEQLKGNA